MYDLAVTNQNSNTLAILLANCTWTQAHSLMNKLTT
jgi:hypothetical protein